MASKLTLTDFCLKTYDITEESVISELCGRNIAVVAFLGLHDFFHLEVTWYFPISIASI